MQLKQSLKKLVFVSLYTSPIIGALLITPIFILNDYLFNLYPKVVILVTFYVFLVWSLNILITYLVNKWPATKKYNLLLSYSLCIVFIPLFKTVFYPFVDT